MTDGSGTPGARDKNLLRPDRPHLEVVPLGRVDEVALSVAAANVQAVLDMPTHIAPARPTPDYALIPARHQYDAGKILKTLSGQPHTFALRLGVTAVDLCLPILKYVFGEAQVGGQAAVVSMYRIQTERKDWETEAGLVYERLAKLVLHEMAHVLGLVHCRRPQCLMSFSLGLEQLDLLNTTFCGSCERVLAGRRRTR